MTDRPQAADTDSIFAVTALIVVGVLGVASFLVLPSIIWAFQQLFGLSQVQLGQLATSQLIGLASGSVAVIALMRHFSWRKVARVGLSLLLMADLSCLVIAEFPAFMVARFISGVGGGVCVSLAAYGLGQTVRKDRNFSLFLTTQVGFAILGSAAFPKLVGLLGFGGLFGVLCLLQFIAITLAVSRLPNRMWTREKAGPGNLIWNWVASSFVLLGIVLFMTAIGGFWTYVAPIGVAAGFTNQQTGNAISIGLLGGFAGSWTATVMQDRLGRLLPMVAAVGTQFAGLALLLMSPGYAGFVLAAMLFCFGWYFCLPFQFALLASVDRDGKPMMLLNAFAGLGSGLGPALAAAIVHTGFFAVYLLCFVCLCLSLCSNGGAMILQRRQA